MSPRRGAFGGARVAPDPGTPHARRVLCVPLVAMLAIVPGVARGQSMESGGAEAGPLTVTTSTEAPRPMRGRTPATTATDVLLYVPRILFLPVTLVTEYLLRRPIVAIADWLERENIAPYLSFFFAPTESVSWRPTLSWDIGQPLAPLVGLSLTWRDLLVRGHEVRAEASFASETFFVHRLEDRWHLGPLTFGLLGSYSTRPERPFYGLGPRSFETRTYFAERRAQCAFLADIRYRSQLSLSGQVGLEATQLGPGTAPSIETQFYDLPGFGAFDLGVVTLELVADSRPSEETNGGARLVGRSVFGFDLHDADGSFLLVDVAVELAAEVIEPDRVLVLRGRAIDTLPFADRPVPFAWLPTLGYDEHHGFVWGRFRGESAVVVELRYRYPVNYLVDMQWSASVGNVFRRDAADFDVGLLTGSLAVGVRTRRTGGTPIEILVAFGSGRFEEPFRIDSARVYIGTTDGL